MAVDTGKISCCFDEESRKMLKDYRSNGLGETSVAIADAFEARGLAGSTVLELGCGFGALTTELVRRGAASAVGVDLSPKMLELAKSLAQESGLASSITYELGDGALVKLGRSDFVVLDSMICCYPDVAALVDNSASATRRFYAYSVPDDSRFATRVLKVFLPLQRFLIRGGFRFFIHPTSTIGHLLESKGFRQVSRAPSGWIWSVYVFAAPEN